MGVTAYHRRDPIFLEKVGWVYLTNRSRCTKTLSPIGNLVAIREQSVNRCEVFAVDYQEVLFGTLLR